MRFAACLLVLIYLSFQSSSRITADAARARYAVYVIEQNNGVIGAWDENGDI